MALELPDTVFPNNIIVYLAGALDLIDDSVRVFKRPLRNSDPNGSIGLYAQAWEPEPDSVEVMGGGYARAQQPTLQTYSIAIQAFVKDSDEARGLAMHSLLSHHIRRVLYTDNNLRIVFSNLVATLPTGESERLKRWGMRSSRYFSGEIASQMLYLSNTDFWAETEVTWK